jgi:hypothetical protein
MIVKPRCSKPLCVDYKQKTLRHIYRRALEATYGSLNATAFLSRKRCLPLWYSELDNNNIWTYLKCNRAFLLKLIGQR